MNEQPLQQPTQPIRSIELHSLFPLDPEKQIFYPQLVSHTLFKHIASPGTVYELYDNTELHTGYQAKPLFHAHIYTCRETSDGFAIEFSDDERLVRIQDNQTGGLEKGTFVVSYEGYISNVHITSDFKSRLLLARKRNH